MTDSLALLEEALLIARDVVAADRTAEAVNLDLYDQKTGAHTQIVEENTPPGLQKIIPDNVAKIYGIVVEVAFAGWRKDTDGKKSSKRIAVNSKTMVCPSQEHFLKRPIHMFVRTTELGRLQSGVSPYGVPFGVPYPRVPVTLAAAPLPLARHVAC